MNTTTVVKTHSVSYPAQDQQLSALGVFSLLPVLRFNQINAVKYNVQFNGMSKKITHRNGFNVVEATYINFYGVAGVELRFTYNGRPQTLRPLVIPLYLSDRCDLAVSPYFLIHALDETLNLHCNGNPLPVDQLTNESYRLASQALDAIASEVQAESEIEYFACNNMMPSGEFEMLGDHTCLISKTFAFDGIPTNGFKVIIKDRKLAVLFTTLNGMKTSEFLTTDDPIDAWSFQLPDRLPNFTAEIILELMKSSESYEYVTFEWKEDFGDAKIEDLAQAVADKLNMYYNFLNTFKFLYGHH